MVLPGLERLQLALEGGDLGELLVVLGEPLGHDRRRQAPLERTVALLVTENGMLRTFLLSALKTK